MKVSREQMAANRERILRIAAKLFRERGFEDVGVAEVMRLAGMTHGGFYGHFASKEALAAEAAAYALTQTVERWNGTLARDGAAGLRRIADAYLSPRHRDHPEAGCAIAALGPELARQNPEAREAFSQETARMLETLAAFMPGRNAKQKAEKAMALLAQLVGAIVLARALGRDVLSDAILAATRKALELPEPAA